MDTKLAGEEEVAWGPSHWKVTPEMILGGCVWAFEDMTKKGIKIRMQNFTLSTKAIDCQILPLKKKFDKIILITCTNIPPYQIRKIWYKCNNILFI